MIHFLPWQKHAAYQSSILHPWWRSVINSRYVISLGDECLDQWDFGGSVLL